MAAPQGQAPYRDVTEKLRVEGMGSLQAFQLLEELTTKVGARLAGSPDAERAVEWGRATMQRLGFQQVRLIECPVPRWVRGPVESCVATDRHGSFPLTVCALGTSPGTPSEGVSGEVIEVHSVDEVAKLGDGARGKIIFYNRPFDRTLLSGGGQYGAAGDQRFTGPAVAAKAGAEAANVRSLTQALDDIPHTGTTRSPGIPAAALSTVAADKLSEALKNGTVTVNLKLSCQNLADGKSADVVGELTGTEKPREVIVMGGHLDSWDKGKGAQDDGAGVCHALEALRVLKACGLRPKRTIRVVLFMNEEISGTGSDAYLAWQKTCDEKVIAAIESDSGGDAPRGLSTSYKNLRKLDPWLPILSTFEAEKLTPGGGGADVENLATIGAILFGFQPETQRYFDFHHSDKDTLDKVHPRELELGALSMATLAWLISEQGL
jgi:hypothetical protein